MGEKLGGQRGGPGWAKTETSAPIGHWPSSSTGNFNFFTITPGRENIVIVIQCYNVIEYNSKRVSLSLDSPLSGNLLI